MTSEVKGKAWVFGNNIDTDQIYPGIYVELTEVEDIKKHAMGGSAEPNLAKEFTSGDIIVSGTNFGCGSSREHAPIAIKAAGVSCVIAQTFARIFYRNSINIGLPIIECPEAAEAIQAGDEVEIDFDTGIITDKTQNRQFKGQAFPPFMQKIIAAGGLINYINED